MFGGMYMDKSLPYNKIIVTSTFVKNDNNDRKEKVLCMIVDILKKVNK